MSIVKEILPGRGMGMLRFGMTQEQIKEILGKASEVELMHYENGDPYESWHYDDMELSLSFDQDDFWRLTTMSVSGRDYLLGQQSLIGLKQVELLEELENLGISDLDFEDFSSEDNSDQQLITAHEYNLSFWLDEGILIEIQWGVLSLDEETINWPS